LFSGNYIIFIDSLNSGLGSKHYSLTVYRTEVNHRLLQKENSVSPVKCIAAPADVADNNNTTTNNSNNK